VTAASGTPLAAKLGVREGSTLTLLGAPATLALELPPDVQVRRRARGRSDVVLAFFTELTLVEERVERLGALVFPAGGLWVAWPKRASGLATDITDDEVRRVALPLGLVDNKVCAVDATWTGLRLVWRGDLRTAGDRPGRERSG
jgi:hypothetical protein